LIAALAAMSAADEQLPYFVYGTLQPGFKNHANVVRGRHESAEPATFAGARVVHYEAGFPGMHRGGDGTVTGTLLRVAAPAYAAVLRDLDRLEAFYGPRDERNMYEREAVVAADARGAPVRAWAYFSLIAEGGGPVPVPGGDWRAFMAARGLVDAADDWQEALEAPPQAGTAAAGAAAAGAAAREAT